MLYCKLDLLKSSCDFKLFLSPQDFEIAVHTYKLYMEYNIDTTDIENLLIAGVSIIFLTFQI